MPGFPMVLEAVDAVVAGAAASTIGDAAGEIREQLGAPARIDPRRRAPLPGLLDAAVEHVSLDRRHASTAASAGAEVPARDGLEFLLAPRRGTEVARASTRSTRWPPAASTTRSAAASTATRSTPLARPPLREDALRQRPAGPRLPARLPGARAQPLAPRSPSETLDYVLREMTGPEGGFFSALDADSEGDEGKFYVWTPTRSARFSASRAERRSIAYYGVTDGGNFEGANILNLRRRRRRRAPAAARRGARGALRRALEARLAGPRRQAAARLERAGDRGARRRRRRARPRRLPRRGARAAPTSSGDRCATPNGASCAPGRTGEAKLNAYLEDHAYLVEALLRSTRRPSSSAGSTRRARPPTG